MCYRGRYIYFVRPKYGHSTKLSKECCVNLQTRGSPDFNYVINIVTASDHYDQVLVGQQERQVTDNLQVWRGTWENEGLVRQLVDDYVERTQMMSEQQVCHSFILFGSFREVSILRAITCSCSARHQRLRSQYAHPRLRHESRVVNMWLSIGKSS